MRHERVLLLKGDTVIVALPGHGLDLAVGCGYNQLPSHAANLFDQQFHGYQCLTDGRLIYRKVTESRYFIYPYLPALTEHAVHETGAPEQFTDNRRQKLGVPVAVNIASGFTGFVIPKISPFQKTDHLGSGIPMAFTQEFPLASFCREKVVVGRQRIIEAPDNIGKPGTFGLGFRIAFQFPYTVVYPVKFRYLQGVADLQVHLPGKVYLTGDLRNAAPAVAVLGEILGTLQAHTPADKQIDFLLLDPHMIGRSLVSGDIQPVVLVVFVHRSRKFLLCQPVILIRHPDVPKDIGVPGLRDELAARKLRIITVRPDRDDLKLTGGAIEIHLEIMVVPLSQPGKVTALEGDAFRLTGQLIIVRIEIHPAVLEVIDGKGLTFLVRHLLTADTAYRSHPPGIDTAEGGLFVVVIDTVLVHAHLHVLLFSGEHQTGAAVLLGVDVPAAADREKACVELRRIARIPLQGGQPLAVSQRDLLTVFATAHVYRLPLDPPLGLASHLAGDLLQSLVAVHALIVDHDKIGTVHLPHLPVGNVTHAVIDGLHHHRHMVTGRGGQREQGVGVTVGGLQHQETFDKALDAVQLQVILPFTLAHLLRRVAFRQPVPFTQIVRVVVHVQGHEGIIAERQGKHILSLHFLALRRAVVHSHARTLGSGFVIYR